MSLMLAFVGCCMVEMRGSSLSGALREEKRAGGRDADNSA